MSQQRIGVRTSYEGSEGVRYMVMVWIRFLFAVACLAAPLHGFAGCKVAEFDVRLTRARFVQVSCLGDPCFKLKGVGVLTNKCSDPEGSQVQVRLTGYDRAGDPVATKELWPFGLSRRVPPGVHPFSIDDWLDYDPDIERFTAEVVAVEFP